MNKEQLVNKFIRCTSQEMQDRVARKAEEIEVVRHLFHDENEFEEYPLIVFFEDYGVIYYMNCMSDYLGENEEEITESDLIRDPRLWVDVREELPPLDDDGELYNISIYVTAKDDLGNEYQQAFYDDEFNRWNCENGNILGNVTHWKLKGR